MKHLLALALLCAVFAGCADEIPVEATDSEFDEFGDVTVDEDSGVLRGVVVDPAIVPIPDATITLAASGETTQTNENGAFQFTDMEPGTHFFQVSALGYNTTQGSGEVVAGVASPTPVKIQLMPNPDGIPYASEYLFKGYIMCGSSVIAACGGVRDFTGLGEDTYSAIYDTGANIGWMQMEMVWRNTQALGDAFDVNVRYADQETYDGGFYVGSLTSGEGPSPLKIVVPAEDYNEAGVGVDYELVTSIFAGDTQGAPIGVALDQAYEMFVHEFHGYTPGEDWRFTDGDGIPAP